MTVQASHPSAMTAQEIDRFIKFVVAGGEIDPATMPALVADAVSLITLHHDGKLIGTAAIKTPFPGHHHNEFAKANAGSLAASYPYELGWVVVDRDFRRKGHGRALVAHAIDQIEGLAVYATTKSDNMRTILPEFGFSLLGDSYPSQLDPDVSLNLYGRDVP